MRRAGAAAVRQLARLWQLHDDAAFIARLRARTSVARAEGSASVTASDMAAEAKNAVALGVTCVATIPRPSWPWLATATELLTFPPLATTQSTRRAAQASPLTAVVTHRD